MKPTNIFSEETLKAFKENQKFTDSQTQQKIELNALFFEKLIYRSDESCAKKIQETITAPNLSNTAELFLSVLQFFYKKYENPEYSKEYATLRQFEDFYKEKLYLMLKGSVIDFTIENNINK
jgi:hypothetical protein